MDLRHALLDVLERLPSPLARAIHLLGGQYLYPVGHPRSLKGRHSRWPALEKRHLAANPVCVVTGMVHGKHKIQFDVHHKLSFKEHPELELEPSNLRTVVRPLHWLLGHHRNWQDINPNFDEHAAIVLDLIEKRGWRPR